MLYWAKKQRKFMAVKRFMNAGAGLYICGKALTLEAGMLAAVNMMQWKYGGQISNDSLLSRVSSLEENVNGQVGTGSLNGRIAVLRRSLLGNEKFVSQAVTIPAGMIVKLRNVDALSSKTLKKGDTVRLAALENVMDQSNYINHTIQTLERERNTVRIILENLREGVILTDKAGKILALNTCAKDILQIRRTMTVSGLSFEKILPGVEWDQIKMGEDSPMAYTQKLVKNDRLYQLTVRPIYKEENLYGALFILYDITESEHREQLRREFTSNVSHELKTPLTSISGFAEMLSAGLYEEEKDVKHFGNLIQQESQRLLRLIEGIIHLTKIEEHKPNIEMTSVKLDTIVEEIVNFMKVSSVFPAGSSSDCVLPVRWRRVRPSFLWTNRPRHSTRFLHKK